MAKIQWDQTGSRFYETGIKQGVLYPVNDQTGTYGQGVAWNGITSVSENPSGGEATKLYADDTQYLSLMGTETFGATISAYTYPDEFAACDGSAELANGVTIGQQPRKVFGLSYVTTVGNDVKSTAFGKKIHLIYGCLASPSEKSYSTINDSPEAITLSWTVTTTPITVEGHKPTASLVIDTTKLTEAQVTAIEDALYGTAQQEAKLLTPAEILAIVTPTQVTPPQD